MYEKFGQFINGNWSRQAVLAGPAVHERVALKSNGQKKS
jgi:hypothetical protein